MKQHLKRAGMAASSSATIIGRQGLEKLGHGVDAVTQREFQQEMVERIAQVTEVLVAQHAEIEALRKRVEAVERGD